MTTVWVVIIAGLAACGVSAGLCRQFSESGSRFYLIDRPNDRSLHRRPVSRSGGVAILGGLLVGMVIAAGMVGSIDWLCLFGAALPVIAISWLDDRHTVRAAIRLLIHLSAALLLIIAIDLPLWAKLNGEIIRIVVLSVLILSVVWMTNLYNFMDGMDGLAGSMTIIGVTTLALVGYRQPAFVALAGLLVASTIGFLIFNWHPARLFMGDTGSATLGFMIAGLALWADRDGLLPLWLAMLAFAPFIVDATVTLLRRMLAGEKIWQAHRSHSYQRLSLSGQGQELTVVLYIILMLICSLTVLLIAAGQVSAPVAVAVWLVVFGGLWGSIEWLSRSTTATAS